MKPKVVILAAGKSSRFFPFNTTHKATITLCGKPIIAHTLNQIKASGLTEIIIVQSPNGDIQTALEPHTPKGLSVTYITQPEPGGMGQALLLAKDLLTEPFILTNPQHFHIDSYIQSLIDSFQKDNPKAVFLRVSTNEPHKYGILTLEGDRVTNLIEKPTGQDTGSRIVGTYLFSPDFLRILEQTPPAEYQLESAIATFAKNHLTLALETDHTPPSLKYPWDLFALKNMLLDILPESRDSSAQIAETAILRGKVIIESGAQIHDYGIVEGPAFIGPNALVGTYSQIRAGTSLESGAQAERYCDVRNSIIGTNTHIHSEFVGDSLMGSGCRIGAGFITANKRLDRKDVTVTVKGESVNCHQNNLGVIMGNQVKVGVRTSTMPGTVIGSDSIIGPNLAIKGWFDHSSHISQSNV